MTDNSFQWQEQHGTSSLLSAACTRDWVPNLQTQCKGVLLQNGEYLCIKMTPRSARGEVGRGSQLSSSCFSVSAELSLTACVTFIAAERDNACFTWDGALRGTLCSRVQGCGRLGGRQSEGPLYLQVCPRTHASSPGGSPDLPGAGGCLRAPFLALEAWTPRPPSCCTVLEGNWGLMKTHCSHPKVWVPRRNLPRPPPKKCPWTCNTV